MVIINPSYTGTDSVLVIYLPLKSPIKSFHFMTMAITADFIYNDSEADTADSIFEVIAEKTGLDPADTDSTRIRISENYDENTLSNIKFTETHQHIANQYEDYINLDNDG